jgi:hypothetical protein
MGHQLCLHTGARTATLEEVRNCYTPPASGVWQPLPHIKLRDSIVETLGGAGLQVVDETAALYREGARVFGIIEVKGQRDGGDYGLVVGYRNSHDKTFPASLTLGSRVFVCDNLAFNGEIKLSRKHTRWIQRDLPALVERAVSKLIDSRDLQDARYAAYQQYELSRHHASDIILRSLQRGIIGPTLIEDVVSNWVQPPHPEFRPNTVWSLFNAYTETFKCLENPLNLARRTTALHGLLDTECGVFGVDRTKVLDVDHAAAL